MNRKIKFDDSDEIIIIPEIDDLERETLNEIHDCLYQCVTLDDALKVKAALEYIGFEGRIQFSFRWPSRIDFAEKRVYGGGCPNVMGAACEASLMKILNTNDLLRLISKIAGADCLNSELWEGPKRLTLKNNEMILVAFKKYPEKEQRNFNM